MSYDLESGVRNLFGKHGLRLRQHAEGVQQFSGEPSESEEMKPQWYDVADIPYKNMWADDHFWLPHVLSGKSVNGHFHFSADEDSILDHELKVSSTPVL
ncbi:7,8-dihydro-8-oxoguanine triphosphatase [Phytophthora citrophthora]|uniref:7,8-dihydro-8-oxoguanine triphosphatase n=1 Tax=Phytophthora citrophthora TaxID=4793 RepID=A0AAD9GQG7_9STRA|nr:7,8-dihydro-8-oxoguanine triphosphatase [Phytophthora citrophthora]